MVSLRSERGTYDEVSIKGEKSHNFAFPLAPTKLPPNLNLLKCVRYLALPPLCTTWRPFSFISPPKMKKFPPSLPFSPSSAPSKKSATPKVTAAAPKAASAAKSAAKSSKGSEEEELGKTIAQVSGFCSTLPLV